MASSQPGGHVEGLAPLTAAGMMEAAKGFRRLKARDQLPTLRAALQRHHAKHFGLEEASKAA